jgi:hypothetical protein
VEVDGEVIPGRELAVGALAAGLVEEDGGGDRAATRSAIEMTTIGEIWPRSVAAFDQL